MREFDYIRWIRKQSSFDPARVPIPPGDDMGAFAAPANGEPVLVTTDLIAEGTDFLRPDATPEQIGWKAMAVSLSDVAAMAALPMAAVVAAVLPNDADNALQEGLHRGMRRAADEFDCPIIGGDVNAWPGKLVITSTVFARPAGVKPVRRSGTKPGDIVCVTGTLGGSILGRHLDFTPRIRESRVLAAMVELHAMMDLSDGLSSDIGHICAESACGAVIDRDALPISDAARTLAARDGKPSWRHGLDDGEDFELLFTVSPADWEKLRAGAPFPAGVTAVGTIRAEAGVLLRSPDGLTPLRAGGYEHFRS